MWTHLAVLSVLLCLGASLPRDKRETGSHRFIREVKDGKYLYGNPPSKPTSVKIDYYINGMGLYPDKPIMGMEVYMITTWSDPRIVHSEAEDYCTIPDHLSHMIWIPALFFREALKVESVNLPNPSRYLRVYKNGTVVRSLRLFMKIHCFNMTASRNRATCHLSLETYGSNTEAMTIERPAVHGNTPGMQDLEKGIFTFGYKLVGTELNDCTKTWATGSYSCWKMTSVMERKKGLEFKVDVEGADVDPANFDN